MSSLLDTDTLDVVSRGGVASGISSSITPDTGLLDIPSRGGIFGWTNLDDGGATVNVTGVAATATATGVIGSVSAVRIVTISGVAATATAAGLAGVVTTGSLVNANITGVTATATAAGVIGTVVAIRIATISGARATATAAGVPGAPTNFISGETATATAAGLAGVVTAIRSVNIIGVTATATSIAKPGRPSITVAGVTATASAAGLAGAVTTVRIVNIAGATGSAVAVGLSGSVTIIAVLSASISGATASATAAGLVSSVYTTSSYAETNLTRSNSTTVTLHHTLTITTDINTTVTWTAAFGRSFSTVNFFIPRTSEAFSPLYIDEDGGFLVTITHPTLGKWKGIAEVPTIGADGAHIEATEIGILATIRTVSVNRVMTGMTAGSIVRSAVLDATAGLSKSFLKAGTFLEAAPHIPQYTFSGQYLSEVLADMMEMTGQEWELTDDGTINWTVPKTNIYPLHLVDDGDVVGESRSGNLSDVLAQITTRGADGSSATRFGQGQGLWTKQETVEVDTTSSITLSSEANNEIGRRDQIIQQYSVLLKEEHWSIREGDTLQLVLPYSGLVGNCPTVRVVSRSYTVGDKYVRLDLQYPSYVDSLNAARLIQRNIRVTESPTAASLLEFDPCMLNSNVPSGTTISSVTGEVIEDDAGHQSTTFTINIVPVTSDPCHTFYYIRYKKSSATDYGYLPTYETTLTIPGLALGTNYHFGVANVGKNGNISAYSSNVLEVGPTDDTIPGTPTNVIADPGSKSIQVYWEPVADKDIAYYHIQRRGTTSPTYGRVAGWISGTSSGWADFGVSPSHPSPIEVHVLGTFYVDTFSGQGVESHSYRVRAVDRSGNVGAWSAESVEVSTKIQTLAIGDMSFTDGFTIVGGGRLYFGTGGLDFIGDDILHFDVGDDESGKINFRQASDFDADGNPIGWFDPQGLISGYANAHAATLNFASYLDDEKTIYAIVNTSVDETTGHEAYMKVTDSVNTGLFVMGLTPAGRSYSSLIVGGVTVFGIDTDGTPGGTTWVTNSTDTGPQGTYYGRIPIEFGA